MLFKTRYGNAKSYSLFVVEIMRKTNLFIIVINLLMITTSCHKSNYYNLLVPINTFDRHDGSSIKLTKIGQFGLERKTRPGVDEHLHTGIDIRRPNDNYINEPIFSIGNGKIISLRDDGRYSQIIIEHSSENGKKYWSVYEHVSGINVQLYEMVNPNIPIARFMNKEELNEYGWQFDHFHLEIMKKKPIKVAMRKPALLSFCYLLECLQNQ